MFFKSRQMIGFTADNAKWFLMLDGQRMQSEIEREGKRRRERGSDVSFIHSIRVWGLVGLLFQ